MKFTVSRAEMYNVVKTAVKIVSKSKLIQSAAGILIKTDSAKKTAEIIGTDIRSRITKRISCNDVESDGSVIVPIILAEILRKMPEDTVSFEIGLSGEFCIRSGNTEYLIPVKPAEDFPVQNFAYPSQYVSVKEIGVLLKQSAFAAENEGADKPAITQSVHLMLHAGEGVSEASDGKRAASSKKAGCSDGVTDMTLHVSAVNCISGIFDDKETVYAGASGLYAVFFTRDTVFTTMMLPPNNVQMDSFLSRIRPEYKAIAVGKELMNAVTTAASCQLSCDDSCIELVLKNNQIVVTAAAYKRNSQMSVDAVCCTPSDTQKFYYAPKLLIDFLRLHSGKVSLEIDKTGFLLFKSDDSCYLVCPRKSTVIHVPKDTKEKAERKIKKTTKKAA